MGRHDGRGYLEDGALGPQGQQLDSLSPLNLHCFENFFPFQHYEVAVADAVVPAMRWLWVRLLPRALHDAQRVSRLRSLSPAPRAPPLIRSCPRSQLQFPQTERTQNPPTGTAPTC